MHYLTLVLFFTGGFLCLGSVFGAPQSNQLAIQHAQNAANSNGWGQPFINGNGAITNNKNWSGGLNVGAGVKAWQSDNGRHSIGVGVNAGQSFGRNQGHSWKSKLDFGVGLSYTFRG